MIHTPCDSYISNINTDQGICYQWQKENMTRMHYRTAHINLLISDFSKEDEGTIHAYECLTDSI